MCDRVQPKLIYSANLYTISREDKRVDLTHAATPERYRFVKCAPLAEDGTLHILEYVALPDEPYTAVSYVWRGVKPLDGDTSPTFKVQGSGRVAGEPISIEVIRDICRAAIKGNTKLLWLDRLSIMQSSKDDPAWQLTKMYGIYQSSTLCVVVPGGLARLTSLREDTPWIHRGWTLQEAVAPPKVEVMFLWDLGESKAKPTDDSAFPGRITEIVKGRCAMAPLWLILDSCISGTLYLVNNVIETIDTYGQISVFGVGSQGYTGNDYKSAIPNVAMLAAVVSESMHKDYDRRSHCLWKCTLMRSTRDPADMIFSIMGMFGVTLDPKKYDIKDRIRPAIDLAQGIMKNGGRASWLGISFYLPPCPQLSTFPTFPKPSGGGQRALIRTPKGYVEVLQLIDNDYHNADALVPMPQGEMDPDGYLSFSAKSLPVAPIPAGDSPGWDRKTSWHDKGHIMTTDGVIWQTTTPTPGEQPTSAFAVLLGCFFSYHPTMTPILDSDNVRGFIVKEHEPGKYHVAAYFKLTIDAMRWVKGWPEHMFRVGGPEKLQDVYADETLDGVDSKDIVVLPVPEKRSGLASIDTTHIAELAKAANLNSS
ncbi:heterokaryon incompatibility protein [Ceratobasidium sp. AG-Ba]|nr:heterokaryon incompatibility protein [Ceratobasidium sp. AG-Ba]